MYSALFHLKEDKLTQIASEDFADTSCSYDFEGKLLLYELLVSPQVSLGSTIFKDYVVFKKVSQVSTSIN